ncbi:MAG TPA: hypothetical protein VFE47_14085, partial [Tepidisphaeraceae bacterium]|nr:hypothetical protein [Tepidisphaeraceae bacterium]
TTASETPAKKPLPTTRPFEEVQNEIVAKLLKGEADELQTKVADAVREKLAADFDQASKPGPATRPTTAPATQPTVTYADLEKLREEIQKQFNVSIEITQIAEWQDARGLMGLSGIGLAETGTGEAKIAFPKYVMDNTAAFAAGAAHSSGTLKIGQPTPLFSDEKENGYIARLTDASPAHAPDLASLKPRVETDAKMNAAYIQANELAKKFLEDAKKEGFNAAAVNSNRPLISIPRYNFQKLSQLGIVPNFEASREGEQALIGKIAELISQASNQDPTPMAIVPMPADRRVIVVQLFDVSPHSAEELLYGQHLNFTSQANRVAEQLAADFFNYDNVVKRLDYRPEDKDKSGS